jgi:hypothetical protein
MPDAWITFDQAVRLAEETCGASGGRAEFLVREARKSGEVRFDARSILLTADDGVLGTRLTHGETVIDPATGATRFSRSDFVDWLRHHQSHKANRATKANGSRGQKAARAARAAKALWGTSGPPVMDRQTVCRDVRARLKLDEGKEPSMHEKTIWQTVRKIYS